MKLAKLLPLLLLSILFTGCIGDNLDDCPPDRNVILNFSYLNFPDHVNRVNVGIYDSDGNFVSTDQVDKSALNSFQGMYLNLAAGNYTAVCWANAFDNTQINGLTRGFNLSDGEVAHPNYYNLSEIPTNDSLYYGKQALSILPDQITHETVNFEPAYIRIGVYVTGLSNTYPGTSPSDYPFIRINNLVPAYNFDMLTQGAPTTYYPATRVIETEKLAVARCNVLRFENNNPITLDVVENSTTNTILWTVNLQQFLLDHNITIEAGKELTIPILIEFMNGVVNVTLADWGSIPVIPEI